MSPKRDLDESDISPLASPTFNQMSPKHLHSPEEEQKLLEYYNAQTQELLNITNGKSPKE